MPEDALVREARRVVTLVRAVDAAWRPTAAWWQHDLDALDDLQMLLERPFAWLTRRAAMIGAYRRVAALAWKAEVALHEAAHGAAGLLANFAPTLTWTQSGEEFPGGMTRATRHPALSATLRFSWRGERRRAVLGGGELNLDLTERLVAFGLAPRLLTLPGGHRLTLSDHDEAAIARHLRGVPAAERAEVIERAQARLQAHPAFEVGATALARAMLHAWPSNLTAGEAKAVFDAARGGGPAMAHDVTPTRPGSR